MRALGPADHADARAHALRGPCTCSEQPNCGGVWRHRPINVILVARAVFTSYEVDEAEDPVELVRVAACQARLFQFQHKGTPTKQVRCPTVLLRMRYKMATAHLVRGNH